MTAGGQRTPVSRLNGMSHNEFIEAMGPVFEYAPWVATNAWEARPFDDADRLHGAMMQALKDADRGKQIEFLRRHSDMQVTPESIEEMMPDSRREHVSAGLDRLSAGQQRRLENLVRGYRTRFGFPFIAALRGRNAAEIIALAEQHLGNDSTDMELYFALGEVAKITRMRLDRLVR